MSFRLRLPFVIVRRNQKEEIETAKEAALKSLDDKIDSFKDTKKEFEQEKRKLMSDMEFWHKQFRSYKFTECLHCKQKLMVWPYEKAAYYHVNDGYVHSGCYKEFLGE